MIRAVIFDMYETLITHYRCRRYFGRDMASDAGVDEAWFLRLWRASEVGRTVGHLTLEQALERIFTVMMLPDAQARAQRIAQTRLAVKRECFEHLHPEIVPMLEALKGAGMRIGLISNCYSEEAVAIRESGLFHWFEAPVLSWEQGVMKPDLEIFRRCLVQLGVMAEECLYVGDGGSGELETARLLGMTPAQALWYRCDDPGQGLVPREGCIQVTRPADVPRLVTLINERTRG